MFVYASVCVRASVCVWASQSAGNLCNAALFYRSHRVRQMCKLVFLGNFVISPIYQALSTSICMCITFVIIGRILAKKKIKKDLYRF